MHEQALRDFFAGELAASDLAADLTDSLVQRRGVTEHRIVDMAHEFSVLPAHLVILCDAVLDGHIDPHYLQVIGFCLVASDTFEWSADDPEGERVSEVAADWAAPLVNHPLTIENVERWRHYLVTGENRLRRSTG